MKKFLLSLLIFLNLYACFPLEPTTKKEPVIKLYKQKEEKIIPLGKKKQKFIAVYPDFNPYTTELQLFYCKGYVTLNFFKSKVYENYYMVVDSDVKFLGRKEIESKDLIKFEEKERFDCKIQEPYKKELKIKIEELGIEKEIIADKKIKLFPKPTTYINYDEFKKLKEIKILEKSCDEEEIKEIYNSLPDCNLRISLYFKKPTCKFYLKPPNEPKSRVMNYCPGSLEKDVLKIKTIIKCLGENKEYLEKAIENSGCF